MEAIAQRESVASTHLTRPFGPPRAARSPGGRIRGRIDPSRRPAELRGPCGGPRVTPKWALTEVQPDARAVLDGDGQGFGAGVEGKQVHGWVGQRKNKHQMAAMRR